MAPRLGAEGKVVSPRPSIVSRPRTRDRFFVAMLRPLGIEKGKRDPGGEANAASRLVKGVDGVRPDRPANGIALQLIARSQSLHIGRRLP
jgi:hypothetical protein